MSYSRGLREAECCAPDFSTVSSNGIPPHCDGVARRSREDEQMPDGVRIGFVLRGVEEDACGIGDASGKNPEKSLPCGVFDEGSNPKDSQPAHAQVNKIRQPPLLNAAREFENYSERGHGPYSDHKSPYAARGERTKRKWGVCSGDQHEYRGMIEEANNALCPAGG